MRDTRPLDVGEAIEAALALLAELTSAPSSTCTARDLAENLGITRENLDELVELLQTLEDDRTGSRIALDQDGGTITLAGDAGRFAPLRLTPAEALSLHLVLTRCNLDEDVRTRTERALAPLAGPLAAEHLLAADPLFGGFYAVVAESIAVGARLRIEYRSATQGAAQARVVDPDHIEVAGDASYLVAWDVEKDAQRTYRLDRLTAAELTDDSAERHPIARFAVSDSLREHGGEALVRWSTEADFEACDWAGVQRGRARANEDGSCTAPVSLTAKPWLFDRILAAGGAIELVGPADLRRELVAYARELLQTP